MNYKDYINAVAAYDREFKEWQGRVEKILKRYRDEGRKKDDEAKFNILWSNVQTLVPACFAKLPQPDVSRRFRDQDPVGRVASLILERALEYEVQHYPDYRGTMKQSVLDRFLGGRGTSWVRYEPHFTQPEDQITEDTDKSEVTEQLDYECAPVDYVHWKDFGHSVARTWEEVTLVWRWVYMGKDAVAKRFGQKIANSLPYDASPEEKKRSADDTVKKQARICELWDKESGKAVWFSKSKEGLLDEKDDPLGLNDFFPCPPPLYATLTNDTLVPVPDFTLYQDQAKSLDTLADRIGGLVDMLQIKGVYDASAGPELSRLFTEGKNGTLIPVKNWAAFAEKQGLQGATDVVDLAPIAGALQIAVEAFQQKKSEVDELSGVIDVMRGEVDPNEKLGQTQIKGQGASLRLSDMRKAVAQYATDILRLKAQVMCTKFSPQTILALAAVDQLAPEDQQVIPQAMELLFGAERLQNPEASAPNPLRSFRIEIAADSLIELDENAEKQARMEMLTAFGAYLKQAAEVGAMAPPLIPLIVEVGKFGLQSFKVGKSVEGTFDAALDQLKAMAQQPQADPEQMQKQIEMQVQQEYEQKKAIDDVQMSKREQELELAMQKWQAEQEMAQQRMAFDQEAMNMQFQQREQQAQMADQDRQIKAKGDQLKFDEKVASESINLEKEQIVMDEKKQAFGGTETTVQNLVKTAENLTEVSENLLQAQQQTQELLNTLIKITSADRELVRDQNGRAVRSRPVLQ